MTDSNERDRLFFEEFEISQQGISRVSWDKAWVAAENRMLDLLATHSPAAVAALCEREHEAMVRQRRRALATN